jgi:hypothetical protein
MNVTRELLERVGRRFAFPEHAFEGLQRRRDRKRRNQRITAGVVGTAIFVTMVWLATTGGPLDRTHTPAGTGPTVPPAPAQPTPAGAVERPPIRTFSRIVEGVPFSFSVRTRDWTTGPIESLPNGGLRSGRLLISKSIVGPQGAEAVVFWTSFPNGDRADPCGNLLSPPVGPSAADLAAAVATAPGTELVTGPSGVTVGGYPAKHVMLTVREGVGCDPGFFYRWDAECWGRAG